MKRWRLRSLGRVGIVAIVAIVLVALGAGCGDWLILPPIPKVQADGSPSRAIPYAHGVLEAFTARSPGAANAEPRAFVLRFSGDAAGAGKFSAGRWGQRPIEAWVVNYPGYGQSTGPRTLKALADGALAAFDQLHQVAGNRPIFVEGFSLGTVPALHVAAERPVAGLVVQNPPPLRQHILEKHGWWNLWLLAGPVALSVPHDLDSIANARRCTAPAVFLIAERDRSIPPDQQRRIFDAYAGTRKLILQRGADHVTPLSPDDQAQYEAGMDWLFASNAAR
jgi:dienelactone hydrolase